MPGTPTPVLGSDALTLVVAVVVAAAVCGLPVVVTDRLRNSTALAVGGGLAYAGAVLGSWIGVRLLVGQLPVDPVARAEVFVLAGVFFGLQAGLPLYLYARFRLVVPLGGLFVATTATVYFLLRVGGESPGLLLSVYAYVHGPLVVGGLAALGTLEEGGRRLLGPRGQRPPS